jgi:hypothetical protein
MHKASCTGTPFDHCIVMPVTVLGQWCIDSESISESLTQATCKLLVLPHHHGMQPCATVSIPT